MSPRLDAPHVHGATSTPDPAEEADALAGLPEIPPYDEVGAVDARALSRTLFERLESLEEGTPSTRTCGTPSSS